MNILQWRKRSIVRVLTWLFLTFGSTKRSLFCWASPACTIKHIHLSVGKNASTQMTISFAAERHSVDLWPLDTVPTAHVKIGSGPHAFTSLVKSYNPKHYSTVDKERAYNSPYYYHVEINDLEPATTYFYKCFLYDEGATSKEERTHHGTYNGTFIETEQESTEDDLRHTRKRYLHKTKLAPLCSSRPPVRSFQTAPTGYTITTKPTKKDITKDPVTFALFGDLGRSKEAQDTLKHLYNHRDKFDAAVLLGDIAYTDGKYHFQRQWDEWFDILDKHPTFEQKPLQIAAGNHDIELRTETGGDIFTSYGHRFLMPQVQPVKTSLYPHLESLDMEYVVYPLHYDFGNAFYSFTYGPAYMIVLNSYSNMDPGSPQYHWLTNELDCINRNITPWVFVMLHCPMYNTFSRHTRDVQMQKGKEHLEPLMFQYRVNGVFAGHIHAYSRSKPLYRDKVNPRGPIHWIVGEGGKTLNAQFRTGIPEEWVGVRDATVYGYGLLEILNATTARWEWIHTGDVEREFNSAADTPNTTWPSVEVDNFYFSNQLYIEG